MRDQRTRRKRSRRSRRVTVALLVLMTSPAAADQRVATSLAKMPPLPLQPTNAPQSPANPFGASIASIPDLASIPSHEAVPGPATIRERAMDQAAATGSIRLKPLAGAVGLHTIADHAAQSPGIQAGIQWTAPQTDTPDASVERAHDAPAQNQNAAATGHHQAPAATTHQPGAGFKLNVATEQAAERQVPAPMVSHPIASLGAPASDAPVPAAGPAITRATLPTAGPSLETSQPKLSHPNVSQQRPSNAPVLDASAAKQPASSIVLVPKPEVDHERSDEAAPGQHESTQTPQAKIVVLPPMIQKVLPLPAPVRPDPEAMAELETEASSSEPIFFSLSDQPEQSADNESIAPRQPEAEDLATNDASEETSDDGMAGLPRLAEVDAKIQVESETPVEELQPLPIVEASTPQPQPQPKIASERASQSTTRRSRQPVLAQMPVRQPLVVEQPPVVQPALELPIMSDAVPDHQVSSTPVIAPVLVDPILVDPIQLETPHATSVPPEDQDIHVSTSEFASNAADLHVADLHVPDVNLQEVIASTEPEPQPSQAAEEPQGLEVTGDEGDATLHARRYRPPVAVSTVPITLRGEASDNEIAAAASNPTVKSVAQVNLTPPKPESLLDPSIKLTPLFMKSAQVRSLTVAGELRDVRVADTSVCQAVVAGPNQLKLIGAGNGVTQLVVWAETNDPNRPMRMRAFEVHVDRIDPEVAAGGRTANLLKESIRNAFPNCQVVLSHDAGELIVSGNCDSRESAERIIRMVRKTCLVPVQDRLIVR